MQRSGHACEARGQIGIGGADDAACDVRELMAVTFDYAEAGDAQAGVDAENSHEMRERRMCLRWYNERHRCREP